MMIGSLFFPPIVALGALHIFDHWKEEMSLTVMGCTILESNLFGLERSLPESFFSLAGSKSVVRLIRWRNIGKRGKREIYGQLR